MAEETQSQSGTSDNNSESGSKNSFGDNDRADLDYPSSNYPEEGEEDRGKDKDSDDGNSGRGDGGGDKGERRGLIVACGKGLSRMLVWCLLGGGSIYKEKRCCNPSHYIHTYDVRVWRGRICRGLWHYGPDTNIHPRKAFLG
jgi:hypothetical protein